jgi:hypothetical protein
MQINPVQFGHSVCDELLGYFFSEFPLSEVFANGDSIP